MKKATLKIPQKEAERLRVLFNVKAEEENILDKYGIDENASYDTYRVLFDNGMEGCIHLWTMDGQLYSEGYLIEDNYAECCLTGPESEIEGDWNFEDDNGEKYIIHVVTE